ncbi:MAG: carbohydrate porin [Chroococcidiopsidaceae cyanobacterium CP_BM_ER_R8_30]|nr:carbohydrate porin [Chroococcidiopsidaceae cyanobacterium CP_BM_ER_R8_30]
MANETLKDTKPLPPIPTDVNVTAPEHLDPLSGQDTDVKEPLAQVTSVSQLSDVKPTDWAFSALQSLVERYGCIAGYPNGTYRGNRAMTRYEFAAGLNACLDRINELIAAGTSGLVRQEDVATIRRLSTEFANELATVKGRVDVLEARTAQLQANQFSTTTKFNGLAFLNLTTAKAPHPIRVETTPDTVEPANGDLSGRRPGRDPVTNRPLSQRVGNPNTTFSDYVWLTFNTSFTGKDSLITQLRVGNGISPANQFASGGMFNTFGVPFTDQSSFSPNGQNIVVVSELFYSFPVNNNIQIAVGPRLNWYRVFDNNRFTFILTGASSFNSSGSTLLNNVDRGSGVFVLLKPSKVFQLNIGYIGENTDFLPSGIFQTSSDPTRGVFGGNYSATAEAVFSPTNNFNIRFLYNRSRIQQIFGIVGQPEGEPLYGEADDGFGGPLRSATADTYEANFDWLITRGFGIFGRYTYGSTHLTPRNLNRPRGDVNAQAVQGGLAFPDLGKEGALATLSYVIPFSILDGRRFLISNVGDGGIENDFEATYYFPVTDNIAVVPAFYLITRANNFKSNGPIYVGNVRLQFSF